MSNQPIQFGPPPPLPGFENQNIANFVPLSNMSGMVESDGDTVGAAPGTAKFQMLSKDEIQSLLTSDVGDQLQMLGIGATINYASATQKLQDQLDSLDPSNPVIPVILDFIVTTSSLLQQGNVVQALGAKGAADVAESGFGQSQGTDAVRKEANADVKTADAQHSQAVVQQLNNFLLASAFTEFLTMISELLRTMKEAKELQGNVALITIGLIVSMTKDTQAAIMAAASARSMQHIVAAVMAGVAIGVIAATTVMSVVQGARMKAEQGVQAKDPVTKAPMYETKIDPVTGKTQLNSKGEPKYKLDKEGEKIPVWEKTAEEIKAKNLRLQYGFFGTMFWQSAQQAGIQATKMVDEIYQSITEMKVGTQEALKESLQSNRQILQSTLDKTNQYKDEISKEIRDAIDFITNLHRQIADSVNKMMSRGG